MPANVTELPRSGRHAKGPDPAELEATSARATRIWRRLLAVGLGLSGAWIALSAYYVDTTLGWDFTALMLPHELGALFAGFATPLAFLWLAISYLRQDQEVRRHTEMLRRQLELLTYPAEEAEARSAPSRKRSRSRPTN